MDFITFYDSCKDICLQNGFVGDTMKYGLNTVDAAAVGKYC